METESCKIISLKSMWQQSDVLELINKINK